MATGTSKPLKMTEIKELSREELNTRLHDTEDNLEMLRFQHDAGQLPNTARVSMVRRDIARLKCVIREHELGIRKPKGTAV
jgi:large subunit ribosomal protein L29